MRQKGKFNEVRNEIYGGGIRKKKEKLLILRKRENKMNEEIYLYELFFVKSYFLSKGKHDSWLGKGSEKKRVRVILETVDLMLVMCIEVHGERMTCLLICLNDYG